MKDVALVDSAFCVKNVRPTFLGLLSSAECVIETNTQPLETKLLSWLLKRKVKVQNCHFARNADEDAEVQYMKEYGSQVRTIVWVAGFSKADKFGLREEIIRQAFAYSNLTVFHCYHVSVSFLNELLSRCRSLQELRVVLMHDAESELTVPESTSITDLNFYGNVEVFMGVIALCPKLKKLSFGTTISDADLIAIAKKCRHLRYLGLQAKMYNFQTYITMAALFTEMVNLDLSYTTVTDEGIESVAINMKNLGRLNLQHCQELTNQSLHSLATHRASTLEGLWFRGNIHITSTGILTFKSWVPSVCVHCYLRIDVSRNMNLGLSDYAVCTTLNVHRFVQDFFPYAAQFTLLTELCIFNISYLYAADMTVEEVLAQVVHCFPRLTTIIVRTENLKAVKSIMSGITSKVTVSNNTARIFANLHDFPV